MFYTTGDAVKHGLKANDFDKLRWAALRNVFKVQCKLAINRGCFDLASMFACQAQFYREALEAEQITENLAGALLQLEPDGNNCAICGDNDHQAFECHHNPLIISRKSRIIMRKEIFDNADKSRS